MSMEILERDSRDLDDTRDTLFLLGGAALMLLGAGLILNSPAVRRYLGGRDIGDLIEEVAPNIERYLKSRST